MSWKLTREGYMKRVQASLQVTGGSVAVLATDLEYMLQELNELDLIRLRLNVTSAAREGSGP